MCLQEVTTKKCSAPGCDVDDSVYTTTDQCTKVSESACECELLQEEVVEDYLCEKHGGCESLADD